MTASPDKGGKNGGKESGGRESGNDGRKPTDPPGAGTAKEAAKDTAKDSAPAKPGAAGSSPIGSSPSATKPASPDTSVQPSASPAKPGPAGSSTMPASATKPPEKPASASPDTLRPVEKSGGSVPSSPGASSAKEPVKEPAKPAGSGPANPASATPPIKPAATGSGAVPPAPPSPGSAAKPEAPVKPAATGSSAVPPTGPAAASAAKAGAPDPIKTSGSPSASAAEPAKSAATGSSAVPPGAPPAGTGGAKPEAPAKAAATGSSAIGSDADKGPAIGSDKDPAKDAGKPSGATGPQSATRVKPEDALTDGPILDLKANRGADTAGARGPGKAAPDKSASETKAASPTAAVAPEAAGKGLGYGAVALAGLVGGVIGAGLLFLLVQSGALAPKSDGRVEALDKRVSALASADAALEKRVAANETALKPLPEAVVKAEAAAKTASERADQALGKGPGVSPTPSGEAAPTAEGQAASGNPAAPGKSAAPAPSLPSDVVARLDSRLDALDQRVSALQEEPGREQSPDAKLSTQPAPQAAPQSGDETLRLADLDERLKALETKGASATPSAAKVPQEDLAPKLAALQSELDTRAKANESAGKALGERLDQLKQSLDSRVQATTEAVQQATQASRQAAEAGKQQAEEAAKAVDRRLQEQGDKLAALDKAVESSAKAATVQSALRAVAADRIADALDSGAPYSDALTSLRGTETGEGAALAPLAPFAETGAPTAASLAEDFRPIAEKIVAARRAAKARAAAESGGIGDRLLSMAESVVQVKRVGPAAPAGSPSGTTVQPDAASAGGEEPEAKVQDALDRGRIDEAAKAFAALPEDVQAQGKEFGAKLKSASEARAAARGLQAEAFKALSAPAAGR